MSEPATLPADQVALPDPAVSALAERVRRLEDAVALLQDTRQLEERVAERVAGRLTAAPPPPASSAVRDSAGMLLDAGRSLLPAAASVFQASAAAAEDQARASAAAGREPWLLVDIWVEFRAIVRMFLDRRAWGWRLFLWPAVFAAALVGWWAWSFLFLNEWVRPLVDKPVSLLLAFLLCKALSREARRYQQMLAYLPPYPPGPSA
ncbi:MAG TPA: hypothetical protein VFA26_09740 [Gemmataceae bacterium]|nr:hypothetical protein [Gemmataceae bacterium]